MTMTWPWISRRAYGLLLDDKERLVAQVDKLIDDLTRQRRVEAGMSEVPRPERKPPEPMPPELTQHIKGWSGAQTQKLQRSQAYKRYAQGETWDEIMDDMMYEDEGLNLAEGDGLPPEQVYEAPPDDEALPVHVEVSDLRFKTGAQDESPATPVDTNGQ